MPTASIEELRMLTNIAVENGAGLQCFCMLLVGQPQFRALLGDPDMEQLRQRIIGSCHLEPMSTEETRAYIAHRLETAGWKGRPSFADGVPEMIQAASGGVPRRINMLFARLLVHGAVEQRDYLDENDCKCGDRRSGGRDGAVRARYGDGCPLSATNGHAADEVAMLRAKVDEIETVLIEVIQTTTALLQRGREGKGRP